MASFTQPNPLPTPLPGSPPQPKPAPVTPQTFGDAEGVPTEAEFKILGEHSQKGGSKGRDALVDLAWALVNSPEFLYRH